MPVLHYPFVPPIYSTPRPLGDRSSFTGTAVMCVRGKRFAGPKKEHRLCGGIGLNSADIAYLDEANVGSLLTEALTADVEAILADQTGPVAAHAANDQEKQSSASLFPASLLSFSPSFFSGFTPRQTVRFSPGLEVNVPTKRGSPCRSCAGASSRRIREPYCCLNDSCFESRNIDRGLWDGRSLAVVVEKRSISQMVGRNFDQT